MLVTELAHTHSLNEIYKVIQSVGSLNPTEALIKTIQSLYHNIDKNQDFVMFIFQETRHLTAKARQPSSNLELEAIAFIKELLLKGQEKDGFKLQGDAEIIAHDIFVMIEMWALRRWFYKQRVTLDAHINMHTSYILQSLGKRN
ncbi:MAG: hypothetical protein ABSA18_14495 [Dehalococcoidia bacterium]